MYLTSECSGGPRGGAQAPPTLPHPYLQKYLNPEGPEKFWGPHLLDLPLE